MKFRFWSDSSWSEFVDRADAVGVKVQLSVNVADVPEELWDAASDCGATPEPGQAATTSGVDALQDTGAFSTRSDAAKMPYYETPPLAANFFKMVERPKTRGQP